MIIASNASFAESLSLSGNGKRQDVTCSASIFSQAEMNTGTAFFSTVLAPQALVAAPHTFQLAPCSLTTPHPRLHSIFLRHPSGRNCCPVWDIQWAHTDAFTLLVATNNMPISCHAPVYGDLSWHKKPSFL